MVTRYSDEERLAAALFKAGRGRAPTAEELRIMVAAQQPQPKPRKAARKRRNVVDVVTAMLPFGGER